jgi:undecaprenyl-phosphate galactose phosphotransferase/putative colanic acid biosynthesis UDP-glucose lipid carrier transferase
MLEIAETEPGTNDNISFVKPAATTQPSPLGIRFPYEAIGRVCACIDAVVIVFAGVFGSAIYQLISFQFVRNIDVSAGAGLLAAVLYVSSAHSAGFYQPQAIVSSWRNSRNIVGRWIVVSMILALLAFLMKIGAVFSRGSVVSFDLLALGLLLTARICERRLLAGAVAEGLVHGRRVVLIGSREELASLDVDLLLQRFGLTVLEKVVFRSDAGRNLALSDIEDASIDRALAIARNKGAEEIILAFPWNESRKLELVRDKLRSSPLPVQLLPDRRIRSLADNPAFILKDSLSVEIQRGPLSRLEQDIKRIFDIVGSLLALVLLLPVMVITAIAIKLDSPGPVFFRQRRNGFNTRQFVIYKFRTMSVLEDGDTIVQAKRFDPRVTRVGRRLRRSSLDELPQLFNVIMGQMSLVGPRPHAIAHDDQYGDLLSDYAFRHHVKPGITGWAQVQGCRGETANIDQMKRRVDFDLWYINNWSIGLDLRIVVQTMLEVIRPRNAY